jgi:hypothetical protein
MSLPTEKEMADVILRATLTSEQKEKILKSLRYMNQVKLMELFNYLQELTNLEQEVVSKVEQIDLRYRIQLEQEIEKSKA